MNYMYYNNVLRLTTRVMYVTHIDKINKLNQICKRKIEIWQKNKSPVPLSAIMLELFGILFFISMKS